MVRLDDFPHAHDAKWPWHHGVVNFDKEFEALFVLKWKANKANCNNTNLCLLMTCEQELLLGWSLCRGGHAI